MRVLSCCRRAVEVGRPGGWESEDLVMCQGLQAKLQRVILDALIPPDE